MFTQAFAEYQPPQQNRGQNMSVQATVPPPPPPGVPHSIGIAMAFIQQSCHAKGPRGFTKYDDCDQYDEVINVELLPKHEAAFNQACNLMGTYFDAEADRIRRGGALEEASFIQQHGTMIDSICGTDGPLGSYGKSENYDRMSENTEGEAGSTEGEDVHGYE